MKKSIHENIFPLVLLLESDFKPKLFSHSKLAELLSPFSQLLRVLAETQAPPQMLHSTLVLWVLS